MSRPDAKKNITTLVNAFGKHPMLRELANLVLIMVRTQAGRVYTGVALIPCIEEMLPHGALRCSSPPPCVWGP